MLDDQARQLAKEKTFAVVTTLLPDGQPMTQPMWVDADAEHLLLNTEVHRQKFKNIRRDPRITVALIDHQNPYRYSEVKGRVVDAIRGERARGHIDELSQRYTGGPYRTPIESERVLLVVEPDRQTGMG